MASKLCLRCDWTGRTSSGACPRCGAPLYARSDAGRAPDTESPPHARSWRGWVGTGLVVLVAAGAFATVQFLTSPAAPSRPAVMGFEGYLIYAARDEGDERLWIWDLAAGTARPGPELNAAPTALVSTYAVPDTWIGLTVPAGAGASAASVLRTADADADPVEVGRGRFVAWPDGGAFVSVLRADAAGGCHERLRVRTVSLSARISAQSLDRVVCGQAVDLGRDSSSPYVTIRGGGVSIDRVAGQRLDPLVRGYTPLGVSIAGDFLVRTADGRTGMYYPTPGATKATMITVHGRPFIASRLLAWSNGGNVAYVEGSVGGLRGVFAVTVGPRPEPGTPTLVFATPSGVSTGSITSTNDLYVSTNGTVRFVRDDAVSATLVPPPGAPVPTGPLLWVLSLPYSPSMTP
jgi:hypothetical protein